MNNKWFEEIEMTIVNLENKLADIEYDHNADDQNKRDKESRDELPYYVYIYFPWSEIELHFR